MKTRNLVILCFMGLLTNAQAQKAAYTPQPGSEVRAAIMDVMRLDFYDYNATAAHRNERKILFKVHHLKVQGDWAFTAVTPLDAAGKPFSEPRSNVLKRSGDTWTILDVMKLLNPETQEEAGDVLDMNGTAVLKLRKKIPTIPVDIFRSGTKSETSAASDQSNEVSVNLNMAPIEANISVFSAPNFQSPHPDFVESRVGASWSFFATKRITNSQGYFFFGNLVSPRGGTVARNAYVLVREWRH